MTVAMPAPQAAAPIEKWVPKPCVLTPRQTKDWDAAKVKFLKNNLFLSYVMYERFELVFTKDIPTAATDGMTIVAINPDYFNDKSIGNMEFAIAHEIAHAIYEHMPRSKAYELVGAILGVPYHPMYANIAQDLRINKDLVDSKSGDIHPEWLFDPNVQDHETFEIIYERLFKKNPPPKQGNKPGNKPGNGQGQGGAPGQGQGQSPPSQGRWRGKPFDEHLPPPIDPKTGEPIKPGESGMKETVIQAAAFAKSQGKMPAGFQRWVDELCEPQVPWQDLIAAKLSTILGSSEITFARPHRRKMAISFEGNITIMPGFTGKSAGDLWFGGDSSGSMGDREMSTATGELCGIITEAKPKSVTVAWCDAKVHRVDELKNVEDLEAVLKKGVPGGGGTDFRPVFDEIEKRGAKPAVLVFFTDGYGDFPDEAPNYPVIWCSTTSKGEIKYPFGEVVYVDVK